MSWDASRSHPTPWLICQCHHSHGAPSQWHHGSTLLDLSKLRFFHNWRTEWTVKDKVNHEGQGEPWRTEWTVKDRVNHEGQGEPWRTEWTVKDRVSCDSSVKSTLDHCCLVNGRLRPAQARQAVRSACVRQGRTTCHLERRFASWSRLHIVWSLTLTLLAVCHYALKALAVSVLSLIDVRMTKRSCCLVVACGCPELCSEFKQFAGALHFLFLPNTALSARRSHNTVVLRNCCIFLAVQSRLLEGDRAECLLKSCWLFQYLTRLISY